MSKEKIEQLSTIALNTFQVLGSIAAMSGFVLVLWLKTEYVPRTEFEAYAERQEAVSERQANAITGIQQTLAVIAEKMVNDTRQDKRIDDHETRLREVERTAKR